MSNILNSVPFVFAYLASPLTSITGNGTVTTVIFDTILSSSGGGYGVGTGIYTAPISGNYLVSYNLFYNNIINGANNNLTRLNINSVQYRNSELSMTALKDGSNQFILNRCFSNVSLTAGQQVYVQAVINNGSAASVGISGGSSPYNSWLFIQYLP